MERLRDDLSQANGLKAQIANDLSTLASAVSANQDLTESLIDELAGIRQEALAAERRRVELDETYRDTAAQLEVAVAARRPAGRTATHEGRPSFVDGHHRPLHRTLW